MITHELKDRILAEFVTCGVMSGRLSIKEMAQENGIDPEALDAILRHFEELSFLTIDRSLGGKAVFTCEVSAHDFYNRGGFYAQEEILKENINKLGLELEALSKELDPSFMEKAKSISAIGSSILSALNLIGKI